jgi:hypothetical protein
MDKVYYIETKQSHKGFSIELKVVKVNRLHNNLINGKIPVACCFKKPSDAIAMLESAINVIKEDVTTQLIEALHGM